MEPFWPRHSPHFLAVRTAARAGLHACAGEEIGGGLSVAVGLSGGADSLALTAALIAENADVMAVCVDHQLQEGSRGIAERAAEQARALGAQAVVVPAEWDNSFGASAKDSLESGARQARYRALAAVAGSRPIFIAHTADDQAETLLLGLMRGQAVGMSSQTRNEGALIMRPLLGLRRQDTAGACAELGLEFWQDPHNQPAAAEDFRRVAVRHEVLPLLERIVGGEIAPALAAAADDIAEDDSYLQPVSLSDDCAQLASLPAPVRRRAIAGWLQEQGVRVTKAGLRGIDKLCTSYTGQGGVAVSMVAAGERKHRGWLEVSRVGGKLALIRR